MTEEVLIGELHGAAVAAFVLGGPILAISLMIAVVLGIAQAAMQLQEQTIPQIVKIAVIMTLLMAGGIGFSSPLTEFSRHVFTDFPILVQ